MCCSVCLSFICFCLVFFNQMKQTSILDGNMQQYVYRQEPAKKCQRRTRITVRYPAYVPRLVIRRRFQRAVRMPTVIQTVRINPRSSGNLCLLSFFYTTILILVVLKHNILGFFKVVLIKIFNPIDLTCCRLYKQMIAYSRHTATPPNFSFACRSFA